MKIRFQIGVLLIVLTAVSVWGATLTDPREIMSRHFQATGGLENFRAVKSFYLEGDIILEGTGLEGTFKQWSLVPGRTRQETDLKVFKVQSGDNGQTAWTVDMNGKLKFDKDEASLKRKQVALLMEKYDFMDAASTHFKLIFDGLDTASGATCYKICLANDINDDTTVYFIDTATFYNPKAISITPDESVINWFSDFRTHEGLVHPYKQKSFFPQNGMTQQVIITRYDLNPVVDTALFEPPQGDVRDFEFAGGQSVTEVPFEFLENHVFLTVKIAGRESRWILDTGAGVTVLDSVVAAELGLPLEANIMGSGAGSTVRVYFTTLPPFSVGDISFQSQKAAVIEMGDIIHKFGIDFDGILGYDFLSRLTTKIDYAAGILTFYDPDQFEYAGPGVVIEAPIKDQTFSLPVTVDGKHSGQWSFDLGAGSINFHYPYASQNKLTELSGVDHIGTGAGGSFRERQVRFKSIEFAGFTLADPIIDVTIDDTPGAFSQAELIGNLGNTLFRHFTIYLDYKHQRLIVEKGGFYDRVFPIDNSGLQLIYNKENLVEIDFVAPGTPADKAGLKKGDIISAIDGVSIEKMGGILAVRERLKEKPGTTVVLQLVQGQATRDVPVGLEKLL